MPDIIHSVAFSLIHAPDSEAERTFLLDARRILTAIPGVRAFQVLRQISAKNPYRFGFTMRFATQADYDAYNAHPDHLAFVGERWRGEVAAFLENDAIEMQHDEGGDGT